MSALARGRRLVWNPIVAKELRSRMRTWRAGTVVLVYLAVVGLVGYAAYVQVVRSAVNVASLGHAGTVVFDALAVTVLVLLVLLVPGLVGGSVSGERERQTLDLLLCTPVRPARIVIGKLVASLLFVLVLLVASIPLFSAVFLLGGVSLSQVAVVVLVGTVTVVATGSLAMLCSVTLRRTTSSTICSYMAAFLLVVMPLLAGFLVSLAGNGTAATTVAGPTAVLPSGPVPLTFPGGGPPQVGPAGAGSRLVELVSPGLAMATVLAEQNQGSACGIGTYGPCFAGPGSVGSTDVLAGGIFSGWREWQVFALFDGTLAAMALGASVLVLRGRAPLLGRGRAHVGPARAGTAHE